MLSLWQGPDLWSSQKQSGEVRRIHVLDREKNLLKISRGYLAGMH